MYGFHQPHEHRRGSDPDQGSRIHSGAAGHQVPHVDRRQVTWAFAAALLGVLVLSAFFSGSETAFMAVRLHRLRALAVRSRKAAAVIRVAEHPERFLGAILTGNVFANVLAGVLATVVLSAGAETTEERARAATLATLLVGAALLVFGEMVPKSIAARHSEKWSLGMVRPVQGLLWLLGPIAAALSWLVTNLLQVFGISRPAREATISAAEMRESLRFGSAGADAVERQVLVKLADATGRRLTEVMTPRRAIVAVPLGAEVSETMRLFRQHGHTRLPVVGSTLDDVRGVLDLRDVLPAVESGADFRPENHLTAARFSPGSATLAQALVQMREQSCRMLIVVDEHGGVEGLVTSSSLLGAIRGPGSGESAPGPGGAFLLDGTLTVSEANAELAQQGPGVIGPEGRIEIPPGDDYDTVAGFVLARTGRIPAAGETVSIPGAVLQVIAVDGHRITRLRIEPVNAGPSGSEVQADGTSGA
ncbi:MAG: HlyC/CorC family transporter [Acidobacteria bacterium]|nr:HlyC/CorC family transporter [Acidobacteriota bacterium]MYG76603.1 HlyC/CorC family transporter [Acidobacteriota bacterium]